MSIIYYNEKILDRELEAEICETIQQNWMRDDIIIADTAEQDEYMEYGWKPSKSFEKKKMKLIHMIKKEKHDGMSGKDWILIEYKDAKL